MWALKHDKLQTQTREPKNIIPAKIIMITGNVLETTIQKPCDFS